MSVVTQIDLSILYSLTSSYARPSAKQATKLALCEPSNYAGHKTRRNQNTPSKVSHVCDKNYVKPQKLLT